MKKMLLKIGIYVFSLSFGFVGFTQASNLTCNNAKVINLFSDSTIIDTVDFNLVPLGSINCKTGSHQSVWFKFNTVSDTTSVTLSAKSGLNHGFEIIADSCNGASVVCIDNNLMASSESFLGESLDYGRNYYLRVFNATNGGNFSGEFTFSVTSYSVSQTVKVKSLAKNKLQVYPNPSKNGVFYISDNDKVQRVEVFNISGEVVFSGNMINKIELSEQNKGVYFVRISNGEEQLVKKIIIN